MYNYLHSAGSRAIHFSAGETFRRAWFTDASDVRIYDEPHRYYLSLFAFDTLTRLFMSTLAEVQSSLEIDEQEGAVEAAEELGALLDQLSTLGRVPLITPEEFNFTQPPLRHP
jgi:hypothetical protein